MAENKVAPSLLAADFTEIGHAIKIAEDSGADWLHLDIMDGHFVPPISFGAQMVEAIRRRTSLTLDAHLMVMNPSQHIESFAQAGADRLTFHIETEVHAHRLIKSIQSLGMKAGISLVPSTPLFSVEEILEDVDQVLIMTVNPGYGGQSLIPSTLDKVRRLYKLRERRGNKFLIAVDGGVSIDTAQSCWEAGVDVAVIGSAFFNTGHPAKVLQEVRLSAFPFKEQSQMRR